MKLSGISPKGMKRIASGAYSTEYERGIEAIAEEIKEDVLDYGEDLDIRVNYHAEKAFNDYRSALQVLQNSQNVNREAVQQLAYEALTADIHQALEGN